MAAADKGRNDIRPGQHPFSKTGRVEGGDENYGVYGTKGYYKTFQPQFKGRPLRHTEMDFNIDLIGQVIKGYRVVGNDTLVPDEIDLINDVDKILMFAERDMEDAEGNIVYEDDGITPKIEYVWKLSTLGSISGSKGDKGEPGSKGDDGTTGAQGAKGAQGATGLTGVKGEIGTTGAQGAAGTAAQAILTYKFIHDNASPNATSLINGNSVFFQQNAAMVINFKDVSGVSNKFKYLGLFATGSFEITVISQIGSNVYNHYSFTNVYVDYSTFSAMDCVVIYAQTVNGTNALNPHVTGTGDITFNGNITPNIIQNSNIFIDKWNSGGNSSSYKYLTLTVAPQTVGLDSINLADQFITIPTDFVGLDLITLTASYGLVSGSSDTDFKLLFTDVSNNVTNFCTWQHQNSVKIHTANINQTISEKGTLHLESVSPIAPGPQGYSLMLKFG